MKKAMELYNKGLAFSKEYKMVEAIKCFDEALIYAPEDWSLWLMKGIDLFFLKKYDEAIASYDKAITYGPTQSDPWKQKGLLLTLLKKEEEAQECFKMAASLGNKEAKKFIIKPKFSLFKRK